MKVVYQCETCGAIYPMRAGVFTCLACEKEICSSCFDRLSHCKECAKTRDHSEMQVAYNEMMGESPDLHPVKEIEDAYPLVLYFPNKSSAQEFIEAVREAYPNWSEKGIS